LQRELQELPSIAIQEIPPHHPVPRTYMVVKGDTLTKIAKKTGSTVAKIYNANKALIDSRNKTIISKLGKWVYPNMKLVIK